MAFDLDAFVKEMGLEGDEEKAVRAAFVKPERLKVLESNQLRQSDYSKNQDALKKAQADLEKQQERLKNESLEWARLSDEERGKSAKTLEALEKTEAKVLALTQKVTRIATEAGLDPAKALEGIEQPPAKKDEPVVQPVDTSKFVGVDQFGVMSEFLFNFASELPALAQEHFDLTGERLNTRELSAEIQQRSTKKGANLNPRVVWEEKYGIPDKRAEKEKTARAEEIKQAETRGFERARSEAALPIPPSHGTHSAVLRTVGGEARKSVLERPAPESAVRSAASALATGKYRAKTG